MTVADLGLKRKFMSIESDFVRLFYRSM